MSSFDPTLAKSGMAYRYPDNYDPYNSIEMERDSLGFSVAYKVFPDSVAIPSASVSPILNVLLDGMHYENGAYFYYKTGEVPGGYDMAMCHNPRFILVFRNEVERISNTFTICFECGNTGLSNGVNYPKSDMYRTSVEGLVAFRNLQDRLFPEL